MTAAPRAILLSAGRGSRLGALTADRPKCLLDLGGRTLLDWQLDALARTGVSDIAVVTGFGAPRVAHSIAGRAGIRPLYNPFFQVADNLASLWLVRELMDRDMLILNGDTLISAEAIGRVIERGAAPLNVTIARKPAYDADDMKVTIRDGLIAAVGKQLPPDRTDAESVGMILLRGDGPTMFAQAIEQAMLEPSGLTRWYLSVVDTLAQRGVVAPVEIDPGQSAEVDYPQDVATAQALVATWRRAEAARA